MNRVDIKIGFNCNNKCQFCVQGDKRFKFDNKTLEQIKSALTVAIKEGNEGVVFTGGEPTIHPDILAAITYAKELGFNPIQIQSNGRMFAYLNFCKKLISAGANEFSPALHSSKPEIHDQLTSSLGAWHQAVQGIKNLKSLNQLVITNTVINSKNYKDLPDLAKLFVDLGVDQFQFAFPHILGTAAKNKNMLVPRITDVMPYVINGLDIGIKAGKVVMTEAIPYCLMPGYEDYIAEKIMPETKVVDAEGVIESYANYRWTKGKAKGPECVKCNCFTKCEGPWKEYPEIYGWAEFLPVSQVNKEFLPIKRVERKLIVKLQELYGFSDFVKGYTYAGHTCNKVKLFEFKNRAVILKFGNRSQTEIQDEKSLILKFFSEIHFPELLTSSLGSPFFKYMGKAVRVYEYIKGNEVNLINGIDALADFINFCLVEKNNKIFRKYYSEKSIYDKFQEKLAIKIENIFPDREELCDNLLIMPHFRINLLRHENGYVFLESEHLTEGPYYVFPESLAHYLFDIIDSAILLDENIAILEIINQLIAKIHYKFRENELCLARHFLAEIFDREVEKSNRYNDASIKKLRHYREAIFNNCFV